MSESENSVFFFGEYEHSLDSQGRLTIPSEWRHQGENRLILLPGFADDLTLIPFSIFQEWINKHKTAALTNKEIREALTYLGSQARDCRCDKQGRIKIDKNMLASINVTNVLKMIGSVTCIKLCAVDAWQTDTTKAGKEKYFDILATLTNGL